MTPLWNEDLTHGWVLTLADHDIDENNEYEKQGNTECDDTLQLRRFFPPEQNVIEEPRLRLWNLLSRLRNPQLDLTLYQVPDKNPQITNFDHGVTP
jgi:hypothetical protein